MNLYFSPAERNELHIPVSQLSSNTFESIKNKMEQMRDINTDSLVDHHEDIKDNLEGENIENLEISEFHEKYTSELNTFKKTEAHRKLNKIKLYFIVKSQIVKGKEINFALPIRCFDDLGNSKGEKLHNLINTIFEVEVFHKEYQGSPVFKSFFLENIISATPPYGVKEEFALEDLILPKQYESDGTKLEATLPVELDYELIKKLASRYRDKKQLMQSIFYLTKDYQYRESMVDNTIFANTSDYVTDPKTTKNNNFARRLKDIDVKNEGFKVLSSKNLLKLFLGNRNPLIDKPIIPVFSNLEDAQDLLITVLEEVNEPFQVRRKMEGPNISKSYRSLDYFDDPFCYQNRYFYPENWIDKFKDFLKAQKFIKIPNRSSLKDNYYHENKYQTKGPFSIIDAESENIDSTVYEPLWIREQAHEFAPKHIWRESDCLLFQAENFPGEAESYSLLESRDMSIANKGLLKKSQDAKIISMGLADFLEFWNNPTTKDSELLFIPSSKHLNKMKLPTIAKKPIDPFYEYQQKFRESKKKDTEIYTYEIIVSSD